MNDDTARSEGFTKMVVVDSPEYTMSSLNLLESQWRNGKHIPLP